MHSSPRIPRLLVCAFLTLSLLSQVTGWFFRSTSAYADERRMIEEDTDGDGIPDRIAHLDLDGKLLRLEIDRNHDGRMDMFQYYKKGMLFCLERDVDGDGRVDERDTLESGNRTRHEKLDGDGRVLSVICFDDHERPIRWQQDTTGEGRIDTIYHNGEGKLELITYDTTGNGRANIWQTYKKDKLREQKADRDGDGLIEEIISYDQNGQPLKSLHDMDIDGIMEIVRFYRDGELQKQEWDANGDGRPAGVTEYQSGQPTLIKYLKEAFGESVELIALGTNAIATAQMLKAGANKGASGENAICHTVGKADCIVGPIAVTWANAMMGEVTLKMAEAVTSSPAKKVLLPLSQERIDIVGVSREPLPHLLQESVQKIKEVMKHV